MFEHVRFLGGLKIEDAVREAWQCFCRRRGRGEPVDALFDRTLFALPLCMNDECCSRLHFFEVLRAQGWLSLVADATPANRAG